VGFFFGDLKMLSIASLLVAIGSLVGAEHQPQLWVEGCEFGEIYAFNHADCTIELTNRGKATIHVTSATAVTPRDRIEPAQIEVKPGSKAYLHVFIDSGNSVARTRHRFDLKTDEKDNEVRMVSARGYVLSAVDQLAPKIGFGVVDASGDQLTRKVKLSSREVEHFEVLKVLDHPDYVNVEIGSDRQSVSATLKPNSSWGTHSGFIKLAINTPNQKEVWVAVSADVHGEVVAASNPIDLGLLRFGNRNEQLLRITSKAKKDFKIGNITLDGLIGSTEILPCVPAESGCQLMRLVVSDKQPQGAIRGGIFIALPQLSQSIHIDVQGLIVAKEVKVDEVDLAKPNGATASQLPAEARQSVDIEHALKNATAPAEEIPAGNGPLLKWTVANGKAIYGFQIFRANEEAGPFLLLNKNPIRSVAESDTAAMYQWRDNSASSGKSYWYYIGIVFDDGRKQQLSTPQKVLAK
jgi:hypothetical protein